MMHPRTLYLLSKVGVAPAELECLDKPVLHPIPHVPSGYGLIGGTGAAKTSQLVHRLAETIERFVVESPDPEKAVFPCYAFARWISWPEEVEKLKRMSATDGHRELDSLISLWKEARQLYLDDIGQERFGSEKDYAQGVFAEVLDSRYRNRLPIFWTSNLDEAQLTTRYGARLMSRLFTISPVTKVRSQDLRLVGLKARMKTT